MRSIKTRLLLGAMLMLFIGITYGQDKSNYQMYAVHEDVVKPSMLMEYEAVAKEFSDTMKKYIGEIEDLSYLCTSTDNLRYMYVWPIENMADFDKNPMAQVREKVGAEKFDDMMARMDKCYSSHTTYTIALDKNMSYMPEGISQTQDGMDYREFHYYYTTPEMHKKLAKKGMAIREYHASKDSGASYRVYQSGMGTPETFFMVAVSAKDPVHMAERSRDMMKKLGPEYQKMLNDALKYSSKYEKFTGWIRRDLSVGPTSVTTKK